MKQEEFEQKLKEITPDQRKVLEPFLKGFSDEEIALELYITKVTVRKHLSNIGDLFDLKEKGKRNPELRDQITLLFIEHQRDWVSPVMQERYIGAPKPDFPGRPLLLNSQFYIRHASLENLCYEKILQPRTLIRIPAAQNMGKTSLLDRILAHAKSQGYKTVYLNFGLVEESIFNDLDTFLKWFSEEVSEGLDLEFHLDAWNKRVSSLNSCKAYFKQYFLSIANQPLVLAMDEIDRLFDFPKIAAEFFALLRGWYEESNNPDIWGNLRQILVYSTDSYIKLPINRSPFNVGEGIKLPKLTEEQIQQLARCYGLQWKLDDEVKLLQDLVGGHPYLVQLTLYKLQNEDITFKQILQTAVTETGIYYQHLLYLRQSLESSLTDQTYGKSTLWEAFQQIMRPDNKVRLSPEAICKLVGLGVIELEGNRANVSCELYHRYFTQMLN